MQTSSLSYFWEHEPEIFRFWSTLNQEQRSSFNHQLSKIQLNILEKQKRLIQDRVDRTIDVFEPFDHFAYSGNVDHALKGQQLIKQGRLGCLLLAGGQGTRLQYRGPKGTYPISVIKHKSLFQLCAEKVKAASRKAGYPLKLAIMTAPENDKETRNFFQNHACFGLDSSQVSFFIQETLPLLDIRGHLFLQAPDQIAEGSNGNGSSLIRFAQSGILNQWMQQGIEYVHVILIDNPLADPFDEELLGFHYAQKAEVTLKCTEKILPEEKVGLLVKQDEYCRVIEYSEMSTQEKEARRLDGHLKYRCANLSLFCFSLAFIQHIVNTQYSIPLHKAWKAAPYLDEKKLVRLPRQPNSWKFETFIFDWLIYTQKVAALIYPREQCFAPLKNAKGEDSPETVRKALQQADQNIFKSITGLDCSIFPFELSADFYYPTSDLIKKWKGKNASNSYIEP